MSELATITADWSFHYRDINTGREWTQGPYKNKVVQSGLNNLASLLIGENSSETAAMHIILGCSEVSAQSTDEVADMGEVVRKVISAKTRTGSLARLRTFFQPNEANGDYHCVGVAARSTDVAGSGELLNRLVFPFSKTSNMVLSVEVKWNFVGGD